jgi:hypothetical protein
MRVALGQFTAAREGGAPADRNVGMFANEQRIKPARFDLVRQFADIYALVGWKVKKTNQHGNSPQICCPGTRPGHGS